MPTLIIAPVVCVAANKLPARANVERAADTPKANQTVPNPAGGLAADGDITHFG